MQFVRTLFWVLILVVMIIFTAFNWKPVEVQIWTNMVLETKIPALVIVAFLLGLVPTWLLHRGTKWRLNRRIAALESASRHHSSSVRTVDQGPVDASSPPPPPPLPLTREPGP